ncbi:MAG: serine hydrolase [Rubrivivax sp.]
MPTPPRFADAIAFALDHEINWPRDPAAAPGPGQLPFGVHHADPPPWDRAFGPLHARGGVSGVVWQHGRELAAWGDPERADLTFSVAKTYLALLAGVAVAEGRIRDLDARVGERLPGIGFDGEHNRPITWRQLLQQTSEWEGTLFGISDQADRWRQVAHDPRPAGGPKGGARPLQAPGSYWEYNDVRINQLSLALLHLFGRPLPEVLREKLMQPVGATSAWRWEGYDEAWVTLPGGLKVQSVPGGSHWGGGVSIGARDQARLGQLVLEGGRGIVDAGFLRAMREPCAIAPFYGLLVWLHRDGKAFPGASREAFFMVGAGGHYTWVEPAHDAVVVVRWLHGDAAAGFLQRMGAALAAGD